MNAADGLPPLRDVIAKYDLAARRSLGQNFLFDLNLTGKIARAAGEIAEGTVIEIGPGPGGLTRALLAHGAKQVIAIERDPRCSAVLAEISAAYPGRLDDRRGRRLAGRLRQAGPGAAPHRRQFALQYRDAADHQMAAGRDGFQVDHRDGAARGGRPPRRPSRAPRITVA